MAFWKRETYDRPSEIPTEMESPSVIDLPDRLEARIARFPPERRPIREILLLEAVRTGSTMMRLRVAVALGLQHLLGRTDQRRLTLAQRRYRNLPMDLVGEPDPSVAPTEADDEEVEESWPHLLIRCYGLPFAGAALVLLAVRLL